MTCVYRYHKHTTPLLLTLMLSLPATLSAQQSETTRPIQSSNDIAQLNNANLNQQSITIQAKNKLDFARPHQTVELPWAEITSRLPKATPDNILVTDSNSNKPLLSQVIDNDNDQTPDQLLFQASFMPNESRSITIATLNEDLAKPKSQVTTNFIPSADSFYIWENDRVSFRLFGPSPVHRTPTASGLDAWLKNNSFGYTKLSKNLGAGSFAIFHEEKLYRPLQFLEFKTFAQGPLRVQFQLKYAPIRTPQAKISLKQTISLDANTHFTRITNELTADNPDLDTIVVAPGICLNASDDTTYSTSEAISCWQPSAAEDQQLGLALIPHASSTSTTQPKQLIALSKIPINKPFTYEAGAAWSKQSEFKDHNEWFKYIQQKAWSVRSPIQITW
ncbi:DUF4861 family protein [Planctomycetota bacterium]|nr:DUF4861 family protein [Planctomycetota bacterium]